MPFKKSFQHDFFRQFFGTRLYHVDSVLGTSYCQFKKRALSLLLRWIDDDFSVNIAHLDPSDWSVKRNIWDRKSQWWTKHGCHWCRCIFIIRKNCVDDLYFITETFRKHRTDRTVNQTRCQGRICRRTTFPFHKATRKFPSRIHFLFVVDLKWEEIPSCHLLRHDGSSQDSWLTITHDNRAICLLSNLTSLYDQLTTRKSRLKHLFCHCNPLWIDKIIRLAYKDQDILDGSACRTFL